MRTCFAAFMFLLPSLLFAQDLFMVRSSLPFPEAMSVLQETIRKQGYQVSRVQRVDIGLTTFGYKTDKYRVVFFGRLDEVREAGRQYPDLVPYLPLKIAIFAEDQETILLASSFAHLQPFYPDPAVKSRFRQWEADIHQILEQVRVAK